MGTRMSHGLLTTGEEPPKDDECLTPCKRVLYFDPRSPSSGIDRTPILVEKTPPTDTVFVDPRSPTPGIVRTPISSAALGKLMRETGEAGRTKAGPTPLNFSDDTYDNLALERSMEETGGHNDTAQLLGLDRLSLLEDKQGGCESSHLIPAEQELVSEETVQSGRKPPPKPLLLAKRARGNGAETRSPLRTRNQDTNSPRNIIQRKQMCSLDTKISCRTTYSKENTPPSYDKENIRK